MSQTGPLNPSTASAGTSPGQATTVFIIDDHRTFADLLAWSLDSIDGIACVGTASTAAEGLEKVAELTPSVVVMDIQMPGTDGLTATRRLRLASPRTAVAVVTAHQEGEWVARAAQAGASAFIFKGGPLAEMVTLLKAAKPGPMVVAPSILRTQRASLGRSSAPEYELTARELEVLGFIGRGLQVKAIARLMGISVHTCRGYIKTVYLKLAVSSRIEAVNRARSLHLLAA